MLFCTGLCTFEYTKTTKEIKIHIAKKAGNSYYKNLPECGTRPRRNSHARVYSPLDFKEWANYTEMVCEKCLLAAKEQGGV